jgi:hypothetical protein
MFRAAVALTALIWADLASAQEPQLVRLPKTATTGTFGFKNVGLREIGKKMNLGGWLVLKGARFRNVEFPVLANILKVNYARQGHASNETEFTRLPAKQSVTPLLARLYPELPFVPVLCGGSNGNVDAA